MSQVTAIDFSRLAPAPGSRIAIVGGCGGIGRALVHACNVIGLKAAVMDLPRALKDHPVASKDVISIPVDVTSEEAVAKGFAELGEQWGGLDVLVFVAGISVLPPRSVEDLTLSQWDEVMQVNLRAAWFCVRAALPFMKESGNGSIITISSSLAFNPGRGFSAYVATKGGLVSFTKAVAIENGPGIRANVVAPSAVDTAFLADKEGSDAWFRRGLEGYVANIPLGRLANPDDVVGPILFLAGPGARYITGQVLHVNGGRITP